MKLIQLTEDYELKPFDCGDADLNGFLAHDAKEFHDKRIGKTFLLIDGEQIAAYFVCSMIRCHVWKHPVPHGEK